MTRAILLATALAMIATLSWGFETMKGGMQTATDRTWTYLADTVMGGVSSGQSNTGKDAGQTYVRLTGTVSTENRGGFIQIRTTLDRSIDGDATGLVLKVRGNGERYFVHLRTRATMLPWQYYQAAFETGPVWQEVRLPLSAFKPSGRLLPKRIAPESIRSVGVVAFGRDHTADVSLAGIGVY